MIPFVSFQEADVLPHDSLDGIVKTVALHEKDRATLALAHARSLIDTAYQRFEAQYHSQEFVANYGSLKQESLASLKQTLRELRDQETDASAQQVFDNYYRAAQLRFAQKEKSLERTVAVPYSPTVPYSPEHSSPSNPYLCSTVVRDPSLACVAGAMGALGIFAMAKGSSRPRKKKAKKTAPKGNAPVIISVHDLTPLPPVDDEDVRDPCTDKTVKLRVRSFAAAIDDRIPPSVVFENYFNNPDRDLENPPPFTTPIYGFGSDGQRMILGYRYSPRHNDPSYDITHYYRGLIPAEVQREKRRPVTSPYTLSPQNDFPSTSSSHASVAGRPYTPRDDMSASPVVGHSREIVRGNPDRKIIKVVGRGGPSHDTFSLEDEIDAPDTTNSSLSESPPLGDPQPITLPASSSLNRGSVSLPVPQHTVPRYSRFSLAGAGYIIGAAGVLAVTGVAGAIALSVAAATSLFHSPASDIHSSPYQYTSVSSPTAIPAPAPLMSSDTSTNIETPAPVAEIQTHISPYYVSYFPQHAPVTGQGKPNLSSDWYQIERAVQNENSFTLQVGSDVSLDGRLARFGIDTDGNGKADIVIYKPLLGYEVKLSLSEGATVVHAGFGVKSEVGFTYLSSVSQKAGITYKDLSS